MRDNSIDYIKGLAVTLMLLVHPLMMMTNYESDPKQGLLAAIGYFVTQPIAGLFIFALGYAMGMKRRSVTNVLNRSLYTLTIAICFGFLIAVISKGGFLFSVLFVATIVILSVGLILSVCRDGLAVIIMGILMIITAFIPFILEIYPQNQIISGALTFPLEKGLMNFWVWDCPLLPYLISGLFGGMLAISRTSKNIYTPYAFLIVSLSISFYAEHISQITLPHTVITIGLCFLYPALLQLCRSTKIESTSIFLLFGRNVTFVYFFHHILLAGVCFILAKTSFDYSSYYAFNQGASIINPFIIICTVGVLIVLSRHASILIEKTRTNKNIQY